MTNNEEIYTLNQLYLDPCDRIAKSKMCGVASVTPSFICTKEHGHDDIHIAHGLEGSIQATWEKNEAPKLTPGL